MIRYNGLDLLRCILMLLGPLIHVIAVIDPKGNWRYFSEVNNNEIIYSIFNPITFFRMETFFIISGFFALLIMHKKNIKYFVDSRNKRVFLPFLTSILTITPLCYFLNYYIYSGFDITISNTIIHLWFLLTLYIVSIFFVFNYNYFNRLIKIGFYKFIFIVLLILIVNEFFNHAAKIALNFEIYRIYYYLIYNSFYYLLFFSLGLYFYEYCKENFFNINGLYVLILYIFMVVMSYQSIYFEGFLFKSVYKFCSLLFSVYTSIYIFNLFKNIDFKSNGILDFFVKNAILIYLFHFPITIYICYLFDGFFDNSLLYFIFSLVFVMFFSIFLSYLISRSSKLSYFFGVKN